MSKMTALPTQLKTISYYIKQAHIRQRNAEELRKSKQATANQIQQAERDAQVYAMIAHTMVLENERVMKTNGGQAVYQ